MAARESTVWLWFETPTTNDTGCPEETTKPILEGLTTNGSGCPEETTKSILEGLTTNGSGCPEETAKPILEGHRYGSLMGEPLLWGPFRPLGPSRPLKSISGYNRSPLST